jgi:restriction system protein
VATLPGIERAAWTTKSTLMVLVDETSTERYDEVCKVLVRFSNLRTARVHLQPTEGSTQRVRFKQCSTF